MNTAINLKPYPNHSFYKLKSRYACISAFELDLEAGRLGQQVAVDYTAAADLALASNSPLAYLTA
jgi:hypothetical protein